MSKYICLVLLAPLVGTSFACTGGVVTVSQGDDNRRPTDPTRPTDTSRPPIPVRPPLSPTAPADYATVDQKPELESGLEGLEKTIHYPETARAAGLEGTVHVSFVVNAGGGVELASVAKGIGGGCDEEALRAVQVARFTPGRHRGRVVRVKTCIAIRYQLPEATIRARFCAA